MDYFVSTLSLLFSDPVLLALVFGGTVLGIVFGAIPGLNATMGVTLLLPLTFMMTPVRGIAMLMAIYIGGISGGFISACLIGIPGTGSSVATCFDGYPMTLNGQPARALGIGIVASFFGTFLSTLVAMVLCQPIATLALKLGPWEYFSLCVCAITLVVALSDGNVFKGIAAALIGIFFSCVGTSPIDAAKRFTFGSNNLQGGINMISLMLGLFALRLLIMNFAKQNQKTPDIDTKLMKGFGITLKDLRDNAVNIIRSFFLGLWIGFLPGMGGNVANMVSYATAKNSSKTPEKFGTGCAEGIFAPEVANNATIGGAIVPMIAMGIPGDGVTAILLGGLMIHGIEPGPLLMRNEPQLVYAVFGVMLIATFLTLFLQFFGMRLFPQMLRIPYHYLYSVITIVCFIGAFAATTNLFNCYTMLFMGIVSILLTYAGMPTSAVVLGFVLGGTMESNLRKGLVYSSEGFISFLTRPVSGLLLAVAVISIAYNLLSPYIKKRKAAKAPKNS